MEADAYVVVGNQARPAITSGVAVHFGLGR
jgi:hypothetical protein